MRLLPATVLLASLTLLTAAPVAAQSASGSARGTDRSAGASGTGSMRAAPARTTTASPRSGTVRGQEPVTNPGVPVRDGTTSTRIPHANFDPYYQPPRVGTVQSQDWRDGKRHRDGDRDYRDRDYRYRDYRYRDRYGYDPYYYDRYYYDPYYYPFIYVQSGATRVEVQREVYLPGVVTQPMPPRYESAAPRHAQDACVVVTVLQPDYRGYWKELRLPVAGAVSSDELRRVLNARIDEGVAFAVRDAAGQTLEIPARAALDRIVVDPCR